MRFEWDTAEKADRWPEGMPAPPARRRWPWLLLFLFLAMAGGWAAWQAARRQVGEATAGLEQEVRAAHALVAQAAREDDLELLTSLLSGREPAWTGAQKERLAAGLLLGDAPAVLGWREAAAGVIQTVTFSADLEEAVLVTEQSYERRGTAAQLRLRQSYVYRRGEAHWLLSPPAADFWGAEQSLTSGPVEVTFTARDGAFATQLLPVLAAQAGRICRRQGATCPVTVRLARAPQSVLHAGRLPVAEPTGPRELIWLPSPSLLGEPVGEASGTILVQGYTALVVATVHSRLGGYHCCAGRPFQEALLAQQVERLGLPSWTDPVVDDDYLAFAGHPLRLADFARLWVEPEVVPETEAQVAAFSQFLPLHFSLPATEVQAHLVSSGDFREWLARLEAAAGEGALPWESAWLAWLYRRANQVVGEPPAWPRAELHLVCRDGAGDAGLYSYRWSDRRWRQRLPLSGDYPALVPAPGDEGLFLFDLSPRALTRMGTTWWQEGTSLAFDAPGADVVWRPHYTAMEDPQGRYVTMSRIATDEPIPEGVALFDMPSCDTTGCDWRSLPGRPLWSPDGTRLLLQTIAGGWMYGERAGTDWEPLPVPRAGQAFWTGRGEIGFITPDRQQFTVPGGDAIPQPVHVDALLSRLPAGEQGGRWRISAVVPVAAQTDTLLVALARAASEREHLFLVEEGGRRITSLLAVEDGSFSWRRHKALSADGRWLVLFPFDGQEGGPRFILYDLRERRTVVEAQGTFNFGFHAFDWAQEGWLARLAPQAIALIAPAGAGTGTPFRYFIPTPDLSCSSLAWVAAR